MVQERRRTRKTKNVLFIAALAFLFTASFAIAPSYAAEKPYKVGVVIEVTGGLSFLGEPGKNTVEMIAEEVNKSGGINGHPLAPYMPIV